jgi:hypothetical protein
VLRSSTGTEVRPRSGKALLVLLGITSREQPAWGPKMPPLVARLVAGGLFNHTRILSLNSPGLWQQHPRLPKQRIYVALQLADDRSDPPPQPLPRSRLPDGSCPLHASVATGADSAPVTQRLSMPKMLVGISLRSDISPP